MGFGVLIALAAFCFSFQLSADAKAAGVSPDCEYLFGVKRCWSPDDEEKSRDVDQCALTERICGDDLAICTRRRRGFLCECPDGYMPFPSINWRINVTTCKAMDLVLPTKAQDKRGRVDKVLELVKDMTEDRVPLKTVAILMDALSDDKDEKSKVERRHKILMSKKALISRLVERTNTLHTMNFTTNTTDGKILSVGPNATLKGLMRLKNPLGQVYLDIDLMGIAKNNEGWASVSLVVHHDMEDVLAADLFQRDRLQNQEEGWEQGRDHDQNPNEDEGEGEDSNDMRLLSKVVSATLEEVWDKNLTKPILFTLQHNTPQKFKDKLFCVYWDGTAWVEEGCQLLKANSTHSVCRCDHLSTFSLIASGPGQGYDAVRMAVVVSGLVFLFLTVLVLLCYRSRPRVTNTARLNLCCCLLVANSGHVLSQNFYLPDQLSWILPAASAYFYLCAHNWMIVEAFLIIKACGARKDMATGKYAPPSWRRKYLICYLLALIVPAVAAAAKPNYFIGPGWLNGTLAWVFAVSSLIGFLVMYIPSSVMIMSTLLVIFYGRHTIDSTAGRYTEYPTLTVGISHPVWRALIQNFFLFLPWGFFFLNAMDAHIFLDSFISMWILHCQQGTFLFVTNCLLNREICKHWLPRCWKKTPETPVVAPAPAFEYSASSDFNSQNSDFNPYNGGFDPQNPGMNSGHIYPPGINPYNTGFNLQNTGMNPQNPGYNPQNTGYNPQNPGINLQNPGINLQNPGMDNAMYSPDTNPPPTILAFDPHADKSDLNPYNSYFTPFHMYGEFAERHFPNRRSRHGLGG